MSVGVIETLVWWTYLLIGPAAWGVFGYALFIGRQRMSLVKRPYPPLRKDPPRVTVLIPAKDEGERVRDCVRSALAQDYPNFSVIAINDRSTDNTGVIMDELAAADPRLRVIHISDGSLPAGWTGKCNALHTAVSQADGDWLLFVDSDVVLQPDALSATVSRCTHKGDDMFSLLPKLESHSFWESLLVPLGGTAVSMMYLVSLTNKDYLPRTAFANGQYLFIRRSVYEAIGGHAEVCNRFCEDVAMARIVKKRGFKTRISWGTEFAAVRMYSSLESILKGWGRNFFAGSLGRPWRILAAIGFVIFCGFSAYLAMAWGALRLWQGEEFTAAAWLLGSAAHVVLLTFFLGTMYSWSGNRWWNALLFPLGGAMLVGIFLKSLRMCITGNVEWRGTHYTNNITKPTAA